MKDARNRAIIRDYGAGVATLAELGQRYGLSQSWVRQIIRQAERQARRAANLGPRPMSDAEAKDLAVRKALLRRFDAQYGRSPNSMEEFNAWRVLHCDGR